MSSVDFYEERLVDLIDTFRTSNASLPELIELLTPAVELIAHTAPSNARKLAALESPQTGVPVQILTISHLDDHYGRLNDSMAYPTLVELAQSDTSPARRAAALHFFQELYKESCAPSSYLPPDPGLDPAVAAGLVSKAASLFTKRTREISLLTAWMVAATACASSAFVGSSSSSSATSTKAILSANALLRPSFRCISSAIAAADDGAATVLFETLTDLSAAVLSHVAGPNAKDRTAGADGGPGEGRRAAAIKFAETLVLCCSRRGGDDTRGRGAAAQSAAMAGAAGAGRPTDDYALDEFPIGHPTITAERLQSWGDDCYTCLRGWVEAGGQVKVFAGMQDDSDIKLKPAVASFLDAAGDGGWLVAQRSLAAPPPPLDDDVYDWRLGMKSYLVAINALAVVGESRLPNFKVAATALAMLAESPPRQHPHGLTKAGSMSTASAVKAAALKMLRNPFSVPALAADLLAESLSKAGMEEQARKAHGVAQREHSLKTAGRAAKNRAKLEYQWEAVEDERATKRQREADSAVAKLRASKAARGLGSGIQLPTSNTDMAELVLLNLENLPAERPGGPKPASQGKDEKNLDYLVDAILSGGRTLLKESSRWYDAAGGIAWKVSFDEAGLNAAFFIDPKSPTSAVEIFEEQCRTAAGDAFARLVASGRSSAPPKTSSSSNTTASLSSSSLSNAASSAPVGAQEKTNWGEGLESLRDSIAARLAWTLKNVKPRGELAAAMNFSEDLNPDGLAVGAAAAENASSSSRKATIDKLKTNYPLVAACLTRDLLELPHYTSSAAANAATGRTTLASRVLYEAYVEDMEEDGAAGGDDSDTDSTPPSDKKYAAALDFLSSSVNKICRLALEPNQPNLPPESARRSLASSAVAHLSKNLAIVPSSTPTVISGLCRVCDIQAFETRADNVHREKSTISEKSAAHAAKAAAEKRATATLKTLRELCFTRTNPTTRQTAVDNLVAMASGRLPTTGKVATQALRLVLNLIFPRSDELAQMVVIAGTAEINLAGAFAQEKYDEIKAANEAVMEEKKEEMSDANYFVDPLEPLSEVERAVFERVRCTTNLFLALCLQKPELFGTLLRVGSLERVDVLTKAIRKEMPKLALAAGKKHGEAKTAKLVAELASRSETPLLLALLDNLSPSNSQTLPPASFVEACVEIQKSRANEDGTLDQRYVIPILAAMTRDELTKKIPALIAAGDDVLRSAFARMREHLGRQANQFREPDTSTGSLMGMSACEQLVLVHDLDFAAANLPQTRYLEAITLLLEDDVAYPHGVAMSCLDVISHRFLRGEPLPLAFMRTVIIVQKQHETLTAYLCNTLLVRLVTGKVWEQPRQWSGFMMVAQKLANDQPPTSVAATLALPRAQIVDFLKNRPTVKAVIARSNHPALARLDEETRNIFFS